MSGSSEDLFRLQIRSILKNFKQFWILEFGSLISRNSCSPFFPPPCSPHLCPFYSIIALVPFQRSYFHSTSHVNCRRIIVRILDLDLSYITLGKFLNFHSPYLENKRTRPSISNNSFQFKTLEFLATEEDQAMLPTYHITQGCL